MQVYTFVYVKMETVFCSSVYICPAEAAGTAAEETGPGEQERRTGRRDPDV